MSLNYTYPDFINLHVTERISVDDANRQTKTAKAILEKISDQPGLILADEVGMGKTFVALAVAISINYQDARRRPIVVMVPSNLKEKWPRDFQLFRERCIKDEFKNKFSYTIAERAEDFLKVLDDPIERRKSLIFLTHGAMSRGLSDGWVKLALIQRAIYRRWDTNELKGALAKSLGRLLNMSFVDRKKPEIWLKLLNNPTDKWLEILNKSGIDPENDRNKETDDDPIPASLNTILDKVDTSSVFNALSEIPYRKSKNFEIKLTKAKKAINDELKIVWKECLSNLNLRLPLLIMDEAHHLKNSYTVLASLFNSADSKDDATMIKQSGSLAGMFERMLFLTATPFQLGHVELCSVLERFSAIAWNNQRAPSSGISEFNAAINNLRKKLDESQICALNLDQAWNKLTYEDLVIKDRKFDSEEEWWKEFIIDPEKGTFNARHVYERYCKCKVAMKEAEGLLKKWLIRHNKCKYFPDQTTKINRRIRLTGKSILEDIPDELNQKGILIQNDALLPFLLSARLTAITPSSRPVFAEGLASSYEAFMQTRLHRRKEENVILTDTDDELISFNDTVIAAEWYLNELENILPAGKKIKKIRHPKISATVNKVVDLWLRGEKVIVFCHYIATGKALRYYISEAIVNIITKKAVRELKCSPESVMDELEKIGKRFLSEETRIRQAVDEELNELIIKYPGLNEPLIKDKLIEVIRRYLRTPSFLVRYFPLNDSRMDSETFKNALNEKDGSGMSLRQLISNFLDFLENRCERNERQIYLDALSSIQSGGIRGADIRMSFDEDEIEKEDTDVILQPNVRLVNGSTNQVTRQKLMLTFNTPFYPDILIASSVMAEGVDLHLNCRYIIHHDLCWNPSTLEQRTGRIDRIGAKAEKCTEPIHIYLPFISETQDEKMYRVVMDRERWFKVVMGENYCNSLDAISAERMSERIPIPIALAEELAFKLEV